MGFRSHIIGVVMMVSINKTLSGSLSTTLQPMCDKINLLITKASMPDP
jgi:FlaG/FlaF family flagellin (archaellin)